MYDRIFGAVLVGVSGFYAWDASRFKVAFSYEPLGPKAFPWILAGLLALCGILLILRPDRHQVWPDRAGLLRVGAGLGLIVFYAALFEPLGFIVSTLIVATGFAMLFGLNAWRAGVFALAVSVVGFFVLAGLLDLNVPPGHVFGG